MATTLKTLQEVRERIESELARVIVGQQEVIEKILVALFSRGHVLIVGVPGLAKTLLVKSLARLLDLKFSRIQFTPDLMPMDIIGTEILEEDPETGRRRFRFVKGPIFANLILADEINRTPPKTQAALLEAMQELRVTAGGTTYELEPPFFVMATQNPIEQEGTYPLPEAQLDRFMLNLWMHYPSEEEEREIVLRTTTQELPDLRPVVSRQEILDLQHFVLHTPVPEHLVDLAVKLVASSRPENPGAPEMIRRFVSYGAGPRASQFLVLGAKARALLQGRPAPRVEDLRALAPDILRHRILPNFAAEAEGITTENLIQELLKGLPS